jgi:hypothetical protein
MYLRHINIKLLINANIALSVVVDWLTLWLLTMEVMGSNLGLETGHTE